MKPVESRANARFQELRRLTQSRAARRAGASALIEGAHACGAYLEHHHTPLQVLCAQSALADPELAKLCAVPAAREALILGDALFESLSALDSAVGVAFVIEIPSARARRLERTAVVLDRLQDPGNLGSILRSAAAAGVTDVFCSHGTVDAWSPKVVRAAMGAHFGLSILEDCDLAELLAQTKVPLLATGSHGAHSLFDTDLRREIAWIFGNEGHGVGAALESRCEPVAIPQPGGQESLNVAAAAAICLFEQVRQRSR